MQWATIWDEGRKELRKKESGSKCKSELVWAREKEREYGREVSNFLAISAAGKQAHTHTQLWQRKRVAHTHTHMQTSHRTQGKRGYIFVYCKYNILLYNKYKNGALLCLGQKRIHNMKLLFMMAQKAPDTHTRAHTHTQYEKCTLTHDWARSCVF